MEKTTKQLERWWRVPLSVSHHGRPLQALAMLLCAMMLLVPQRAGAVAGSDWGEKYSFLYRYLLETDNLSKNDSKLKYDQNNNGNSPYIQFTVGYGCEYMGYKEGFMEAGNGLDIWASKDAVVVGRKSSTSIPTKTSSFLSGTRRQGVPSMKTATPRQNTQWDITTTRKYAGRCPFNGATATSS